MTLNEPRAGATTCRTIGEVVLAVDGVSLAFGGVKALTDVSFDVRAHEVRAIIGPNGAGKSSMLNVINGVYRPQQGRITYLGRTHGHMDPQDDASRGIPAGVIAALRPNTIYDYDVTTRKLELLKQQEVLGGYDPSKYASERIEATATVTRSRRGSGGWGRACSLPTPTRRTRVSRRTSGVRSPTAPSS